MNIFSVVGLIIAIASFILAFYTFVNAKKRMHFIWGFFSLSVATWGLGIFKFTTTLNIEKSIFWWRIAEIGVIFIPVLLVHFVLEFLEKRKNKFLIIFYTLSFIFFFFNIFTDSFFGQLRFAFGQFYYITPTNLYSLFILIFLGSAIFSIVTLYKAYKEKDDIIRHQIKYLIIAFAIGFIGGATSFLPVYNINIYPVFNITIVASALTVVYSMFKYQLLEIKVIATQFLIFTIWFFLFGRILLAEEWKERIIDGILLIMVIFFGTLLIRSVLKEIKTREQMEKLAGELGVANEKLKQLDQAKTEFLSIASHQLRSPLTAIKGYSSMILEGSYGAISDKIKETIDKIFVSSNRLVSIIGDFLDVSRIELGKMQYEFADFDIREMINNLTEEFKANYKHQNVELNFESKDAGKIMINADFNKIRQVFSNIIDNAMKYTDKGFVRVFLSQNPGKIIIAVKDSGRGMDKDDLGKIFQKFSRANGAAKSRTQGSGLGLYVASEMVKAHKGRVWAESEGIGKGSTFFVELSLRGVPPHIIQQEKQRMEQEKKEKEEKFKKFLTDI